nr:FCD domain-containing protein [Microbacterium sp. MF43]
MPPHDIAVEASGDSPGYRPGYLVAADRILDLIASHQLGPGDRLPTERALAQSLGMSWSVVREAIKVLSAVGRLSVEKGRGIYVADAPHSIWSDSFAHFRPTDPEQIHSLFEIRVALEELSVRLACERAAPAQVQAIASAAAETMTAAGSGNTVKFAVADAAFHRSIAVAGGNEYLVSMLTGVQQLHERMSVVALEGLAAGPLAAAAAQHRAIADAVSVGDAARAATLLVDHIQTARRQVQQAIRERVFSASS